MTRTPVKVNTEAPPQWRGREGWIVERKPGDYYLVDLKGGGQGAFHDKELDRPTDAAAEPATATVMVGHCPVTVPASTVLKVLKVSAFVTETPAWPAYSADYQAGYRAGYAAGQKAAHPFELARTSDYGSGMCPQAEAETIDELRAQQASDFERIVSMERKADRD